MEKVIFPIFERPRHAFLRENLVFVFLICDVTMFLHLYHSFEISTSYESNIIILFCIHEPDNVDIEWSRLMRLEPPALEKVKVKPEIKPESVDDCMAGAETSPTLELDF